jgi:hypothetical protein
MMFYVCCVVLAGVMEIYSSDVTELFELVPS